MKMWLRINMKKIVILMLALIIAVGTFFMYPRANFNSTDNLETKVNKATINNNWDPSGMGVTPDAIIKTAVNFANNTGTTYASGCIGVSNEVIKAVQPNSNLFNGTSGWENNSTINGISAAKAKYASASNTMNGNTWYNSLGMDANSLQPGDIIIGDGHSMIYLGQANSYAELNENLKKNYGVEFSGLHQCTANNWTEPTSSSFYKDYLNTAGHQNMGCTYWTIDANGNNRGARVSNYTWTDTSESSGSWNLNNMKVYRFAKPTGEYSLKIVKKPTTSATAINDYSNALAGAQFKVDQYLNSDGGTPTTTTNSKTVETTAGLTTIYEPVSITSTSADRYQLKEIKAPDGYTIINGWTIGLQVHKKLEGSTYKVDHVTFLGTGLAADGAEVKPGHDIKINSNGGASIDSDTSDYIIAISLGTGENCEIVVTWKNPIEITGSYNVYLGKKSSNNLAEDAFVPGITYNVSQTVEGTEKFKNKAFVTENKLINVSGEVAITDISKNDNYVFSEINSPGYVTRSGSYGVNVIKKIDGNKYVIDHLQYYSGAGASKKEADIQLGETYWILSDRTASKTPTEAQKRNSIAYITLKTDGSEFSYVGINEPIVPEGKFNLNLVKYIKNTTEPLTGAGFKIKIENKATKKAVVDSNIVAIDGTKEYKVDSNGKINISGINIDAEGITYVVTITETTVPEGYTGIAKPVTFEAVSALSADGKTLALTNNVPTVENAKKVEVTANQIWVELENMPKVEIHKGVKDVQNQDSGYNGDEVHDWVIQSNVPLGIDEFTKYVITDVIDERLEFLGTETITAKIVDGEELAKDTDYKVNYDENTRTLKISFIEDAFVAGKSLPENSIIEIRFNTKFAVDENGNIIALNQAIPNTAELTYNNGTEEETKKSETPEVHTGVVGLFKYDEKTGNALEGAEFKIATTKENAENGVFVKDVSGNDSIAISNEKGVATFTGLEFGEDAINDIKYKTIYETTGAEVYKYNWEEAETKYYIVETKSPAGYRKIEEPIEVTVNKDFGEMKDIEDLVAISNERLKFDLALRKWVTQAIVTEKGQTTVTETGHKAEDDPEDVVKVDLKKSKIDDVTVKFRYSIRITNEGEVAGEAEEISDYIPAGLKFVQEDNPDWKEVDGKVVTNKLDGTVLAPGQSAEVEIILTWVNSESNMGVMINTAEISKDYNEFGTPDIDSTPNNKVPKEDDIDDAPVMISITTGETTVMIMSLALGVVTIIGTGVSLIKKYV